jgi:SAM-dependent methyltransferase
MDSQDKADAEPHREEIAPSPWVVRFCGLVPAGGTVLDVAAGSGRHSRFFLALGHPVVAVDRDVTALDTISDECLTVVAGDLEAEPWPFGDRKFGGVVVTNYLHRPLLSLFVAGVAEGGALIYETFAQGNEAYGRPRNPDFLLRPGELLEAVRNRLSVVAYEHGLIEAPRPAVVQRIAAVRKSSPSLIPTRRSG